MGLLSLSKNFVCIYIVHNNCDLQEITIVTNPPGSSNLNQESMGFYKEGQKALPLFLSRIPAYRCCATTLEEMLQ